MIPEPPVWAPARYYWPNKLGRSFLLALEDVTGRSSVNAVLNQARLRHLIDNYPPDNLSLGWSFEEMAALNQALEEIHGAQGGRGLALRAGRAGLYHISKDLEAVVGVADLAFRVLPLGTKVKVCLQALADMFNNTSDQVVRIEEAEDHLLFRVDRCPVCWGRTAQQPICHAVLGLIQEGLHWATGAKNYSVAETRCIAAGDASCTYVVGKQPHG